MTVFADIEEAHRATDADLRERLGMAITLDAADMERIQRTIELNDNAYFFMLIARFEAAVKDLTKQRIQVMRALPDAAMARAWGVLSHESLFFLNHVALLTDKGGSDYRDIQELYKDRNAIAHGKLAETKPNVTMIATILSGILARLEGTP